MKFVAQHISFEQVDRVFNFALGDRPGLPDEDLPEVFVILSFGEEGDQERELGLTGLHIETSDGDQGYGKVEHIAYDGHVVSIARGNHANAIEATVATDMMTPDEIRAAVNECNRANATRREAQA